MLHVPNKYRLRKGSFASDDSYGNNGCFIIPYYKMDYAFTVIVSDGEGWEHVSVSIFKIGQGNVKRCPTWQEMCFIKDLFWDKSDTVIQFHPPEEEYVNLHPFVLHLWRPVNQTITLPDKMFV